MSEENPTDAEIAYLAGFLQILPASCPDRRTPALAREVLRLRAGLTKLRAYVGTVIHRRTKPAPRSTKRCKTGAQTVSSCAPPALRV
jgi:hypothetical protein